MRIDTITNNLLNLLSNKPELKDVLTKLDSDRINWGLYAGSFVSLITQNRIPTDVDILVDDRDYEKLKQRLSRKAT